ncbi:hypothetical protein EES42_30970 [Streptomyces sp. ADI95-17]|nr:hypothetical protein EES42_30970 [Streptomyces sp. ADI95-17]
MRLDGEASFVKPLNRLMVLPAMDIDLHRVPAIALSLQPRCIADMEAEQQRPTGPKHSTEMRKNRTDLIVRNVDQ